MVRIRVRFVGADSHREFLVDMAAAEHATGRLGDPDAVLTFSDDHGTTYIPVRNITYMTIYTR